MKYSFGDVVIVNRKNVGVVLRVREDNTLVNKPQYEYDIYTRVDDEIRTYKEKQVDKYILKEYLNSIPTEEREGR